jgi:hypothetical protein
MTLAEVGRAGQRINLLQGGDVASDGRLPSVQEIQQHFRGDAHAAPLAPAPQSSRPTTIRPTPMWTALSAPSISVPGSTTTW